MQDSFDLIVDDLMKDTTLARKKGGKKKKKKKRRNMSSDVSVRNNTTANDKHVIQPNFFY
jgi:hypothetical protein